MDTSNTTTPVTLRKEMGAEVFVEIFLEGISANPEWEWHESAKLIPNQLGKPQLTFLNVEIIGEIIIGNIKGIVNAKNFPYLRVLLSNCRFEKLLFQNTRVESIIFSENTVGEDISIQSSEIGGISVWKDSQIGNLFIHYSTVGDISINDKSCTGSFWIEKSNLGNCKIYRESQIGFFSLRENSKCGDISIEGSTTGNLILENSTACNFYIENSKTGDLRINSSNTGSFYIEKSMIWNFRMHDCKSGDIMIEKESILGRYGIYNSQIMRFSILSSKLAEVQLWNSEIQRVWVKDYSFISYIRFLFHPQKPTHLIFEDSELPYFDLKNTTLPEFNTVMIRKCKINNLDLKHTCNFGSIFVEELFKLDEWRDFESFKKKHWEPTKKKNGEYKFIKRKEASIIHFISSDLGKFQFINSDLQVFDKFEFSNTKMLDVFVAGSQMPNDKAFCLPGEVELLDKISIKTQERKASSEREEIKDEIEGLNNALTILNKKKPEQKRLAYGQFKKIYENRGDVAGSLPYLAFEMNAYLEELDLKPYKSNRGERWMLRLNKYSTNYGNDWLLGVKRTFWAVVICYSMFCFLQGFMFNLELKGWKNIFEFIRIVSYAPYYLNPLRDIDSVSPVDELEIKSLARIWDFFSRIIVAYFAYQTIQAFRKLGKSSG